MYHYDHILTFSQRVGSFAFSIPLKQMEEFVTGEGI